MIPAEFDYVAPDSLDAALGRAARGRRGREGARRRPLAAAADEAAAGGADAARRPAQGARAERDPARATATVRIGAMTAPPRRSRPRRSSGLAAKAAATIADQQVRNRGTIGGSLAHGDPASDLPAVLLALEGSVDRPGRAAASARSPPPTCSRTT